jgi:ElaB/YqjD/DUF883 family membrane-anchored ribosome-binding protein
MENVATNDFKSQQMKGKLPLVAVNEANKQTQSGSGHERHFPKEDILKSMTSKSAEAYDSTVQVVKRNPITSLAVAAAVGVAAGYFLRRR